MSQHNRANRQYTGLENVQSAHSEGLFKEKSKHANYLIWAENHQKPKRNAVTGSNSSLGELLGGVSCSRFFLGSHSSGASTPPRHPEQEQPQRGSQPNFGPRTPQDRGSEQRQKPYQGTCFWSELDLIRSVSNKCKLEKISSLKH